MPDLASDTIYRILDDFVEAGLLRRLEGHRVLRYDTNASEHDHFICTVCGRLFDFTAPDRQTLPSACDSFGSVTSVEVQVRGVCKDCQNQR